MGRINLKIERVSPVDIQIGDYLVGLGQPGLVWEVVSIKEGIVVIEKLSASEAAQIKSYDGVISA